MKKFKECNSNEWFETAMEALQKYTSEELDEKLKKHSHPDDCSPTIEEFLEMIEYQKEI